VSGQARITLAGLALMLAGAAAAIEPAAIETTRRGPWAPAQFGPADGVAREGAALQAQAEAKLRAAFDAAAAPHGGQLTREQAKKAGLGWLARHFDAVDRRRAGSVRFDEVQRYARERSAAHGRPLPHLTTKP
jgi:hypothetical protein